MEKAFQQDSSVYNTQKNTANIEMLAGIREVQKTMNAFDIYV